MVSVQIDQFDLMSAQYYSIQLQKNPFFFDFALYNIYTLWIL